jgi:hypothetical protein
MEREVEAIGKYCDNFLAACGRAKLWTSVLLIGWLLFPVGIQTVFNPTDAIGFQTLIQHQPIRRFYTWRMAEAGEFDATFALVTLSLLMLWATVLFFRRTQYFVKLFPVAGLLAGIIANGLWWFDKGFFDQTGALAGLAPLALMVSCEAACEHFGADFVFGKGNRPSREEAEAASWAS